MIPAVLCLSSLLDAPLSLLSHSRSSRNNTFSFFPKPMCVHMNRGLHTAKSLSSISLILITCGHMTALLSNQTGHCCQTRQGTWWSFHCLFLLTWSLCRQGRVDDTWPLTRPRRMKLTPCVPLKGSKKAEGVCGMPTPCSLGLCQPGCHEDNPERNWTSQPRSHSRTQSQMPAYAGSFKMDLHLASLLEPWHSSLWCCSSLFTSHDITSEWNNFLKISSKIALLVHCQCSTVRYKAHSVHLPPWIKKGGWDPSPGLLWHTATIWWPFLLSLVAIAPDLFKSLLFSPSS